MTVTVSMHFVNALFHGVPEMARDRGALLRRAGISPFLLEAPHGRVTVEQFATLYRLLVIECDDETPGFFARSLRGGTLKLLCLSLLEEPIRQTKRHLGAFLQRAPVDWFYVSFADRLVAHRVREHLAGHRVSSCTVKEVAKALHMSVRTLSRRLAEEGTHFQAVKDEFRRDHAIQVLIRSDRSLPSIADELGYRPNRAARALITGKTHNIGLIVADIANPFFPPMIKAAESQARLRDYNIFVAETNEDPAVEEDLIRALAKQVDGVQLCSPRLSNSLIEKLSRSVPLVVVNRVVPGLPCVLMDVADGARQADGDRRAGERPGAAAGGDEAVEAPGLLVAEQVGHEAPENRDHEQVEHANPDEECLRGLRRRHPGLEEHEEDQQIGDEEQVDDRQQLAAGKARREPAEEQECEQPERCQSCGAEASEASRANCLPPRTAERGR